MHCRADGLRGEDTIGFGISCMNWRISGHPQIVEVKILAIYFHMEVQILDNFNNPGQINYQYVVLKTIN
jgi:hypothetical protein